MKGLIEFNDYSLIVENIDVLSNINLSFEEGKVILIYGPRGSGKSTLLRSLVRLNEEIYYSIVEKGEIFFNGKNLRDFDVKFLRKQITYVDTSFLEAMDELSFKGFVELGFRGNDFSLEDFSKELDDFEILRNLDKGLNTPLKCFYPADKIMLLLFFLSVKSPQVILIDSILDHLDDENLERVSRKLKTLSCKSTMIISTRFHQRFLPIADLLVVIRDGKIEYEGVPEFFVLEG